MTRVRDPDDVEWTVRRRWLDGRRRLRWRGKADALDAFHVVPDGAGDGPLAIIGLVLLAVALLLLVIFIAIPLVILVVELLALAVVLAVTLAGRVLLGRPWTLEVRRDGELVMTREVAGWRESRQALAELREGVREGRVTP